MNRTEIVLCPHEKITYNCILCNPRRFCIHDKRKELCKDCKGSSICIHNNVKQRCRDCNGSAFCSHDKRKELCKDCKGSSICIHNNVKQRCRDCSGSAFCSHDKRRDQCRDCNGTAFCNHDKAKQRCRECNGSAFCNHDKRKELCRECGGSAFCSHDKRKNQCRDCSGTVFCIHDKRKELCKDCKGSSICIHDKVKQRCRECNGSAFCSHDKRKELCKEHGGKYLCKEPLCETIRNKKYILYKGYCTYCFIHLFPNESIARNYKTKEKCVTDYISSLYTGDQWRFDKTIQDGCSKRRPDALLDMGSHLLIVEVDEHKHSSYDCSCENKRLMQLSIDVGHRPIVFIRFNPDANDTSSSCFSIHKKTGLLYVSSMKKDEWNKRLKSLCSQITYWKQNQPSKVIEIIELFY